MGVIVVVRATIGLAVSEAKTKIMCLRTKESPEATVMFSVEAAGQVFNQMNEFVYLGGNVSQNTDSSMEVDRRVSNAWYSFRKYTLEPYDRSSAPLELKIRILRAEIPGTKLYGCVTWSPSACHYDTLHTDHHRFLTHCIGWRKHNRADHPVSYLDMLIMKAGSESISRRLCAGGLSSSWRLWRDDVRKTCGGRRLRGGGAGKRVNGGVSWMTSELSVSTPTSGRLQPRTRRNGARRRNKGRNVSWRNGSLQRKLGLDFGMQ